MSITWNGVSSDTIGVVVERIPNRYVPTRRFSPQQVAGRNGNILLVDKSFPNVEQEYEVYLSAEAQGLPSVARACAEWLMGPDGYCRLQDSYDTTVYREAFLMGGYDLENILNKFGRCTITFSCKPQKYLLTGDTPISIPAGATTTYTGSSVQFDGITGASITSLSTTITPTQDLHGYANPWPGGGGKNKIITIDRTFTNNGVPCVCSSAEETVSLKGTAISSGGRTAKMTIDVVLPAGTYTFSVSAVEGTRQATYIVSRTDNNQYIVGLGSSFTLNEETAVYIGANVTNGTTYDEVVHLQIESGSTATAWHPYSNICPISGITGLSVYVSPTQDIDDAEVYNVDWSAQAGTVYGGTLDVVTGVLTVDKAYALLNDPDKWVSTTGNVNFTYDVNFSDRKLYNDSFIGLICSYIQVNSSQYSNTGRWSGATSGKFGIKNSDITLAQVKQDATDGKIAICYELATPLTYQLSAQEIGVLVGTNHVWLSNGGVSLTVTTPLGGIVTNPTPFEARPLLEVSGVGEITINGKTIQILESVSDFQIDCEAMEAEDNSKIYCVEFPELSGGENVIVGDGSITALTVTPRWWTL